MKLKPVKLAPVLITAGVITLVCLLRVLIATESGKMSARPRQATHLNFFERLERMTYDIRVREALKFAPTVATNLGFVYIDDASIAAVQNGSLGYHYYLYWPRQVYGRLVEELARQNAKAIAFDVFFGGLRPAYDPPVEMANGKWMESDQFFALQMQRVGNVILAARKELTPPPLFSTNAFALGDGATDKDPDGILRRAKAFRIYREWHPLFKKVADDPDWGIDLSRARVEPGQILLPRSDGSVIKVPIDANTNFEVADFPNVPPGMPPKARAFTDVRVWQMGIVLAAKQLGLDLAKAEVDLPHGRIVLRGADGVKRIIPVDRNGYFYIDWCLTPNDPRLTEEPIQKLLMQDKLRLEGKTNGLENLWAGKLVVVGSSATGNDLTDLGATPIQDNTLLMSEYWNVANSVLMNRFIRRSSLETDLLLIIGMGVLAAFVTWQLRALVASLIVGLSIAGYTGLSAFVFVKDRYWLPLVLPLGGALLLTHVCLVTWRVVFEQAERRRVKSVFSRIVSPDIVNELLQAEKLSLGGARREVTVLFADVRGFTEFTDKNQESTAAYIATNNLSGEAAEAYSNERARETLNTVNTYLATVADMVKKHAGTLDKYIGDCVMAFWGAPTPNPKHALDCVHAAMDAQRAVYELNKQRLAENKQRELENPARVAAGLVLKPPLPILLLGSGINTGMATVGLMGSEAHISNYTVFGREVNLASRLETLSGRGRIFISETTYEQLQRDDPALAAACVAQAPAKVKGISAAVKVYEVLWRPPGSQSLDEEFFPATTPVRPES